MNTTSYLKAQLRKQAVLHLEKIATDHGHVGVFATITAPSKYHPVRDKSGELNPAWVAFGKPEPLEAQRYLRDIWMRIRATLHRDGIKLYGLRFSEQQRNGCPHWHLLMFVAPEYRQRYEEVITSFAQVEHDGDDRRRSTLLHLEAGKNTAVGYIAKYIAKDIDGDSSDDHRVLDDISPYFIVNAHTHFGRRSWLEGSDQFNCELL
ncbi:replication endonuclease [Collimonas sp.]|jgi:hypothetical protein|uniref:replication endonuclease n=1 Tax=Collimonas sp. TaxID=1963772 RepID=UPI002C65C42C|nr:replication endonuclease [Collimonas sp.]HWX02238.1 replication endonuclease [Collimonas sp.]